MTRRVVLQEYFADDVTVPDGILVDVVEQVRLMVCWLGLTATAGCKWLVKSLLACQCLGAPCLDPNIVFICRQFRSTCRICPYLSKH